MNLLVIGNRTINLDNVLYFEDKDSSIEIVFSTNENSRHVRIKDKDQIATIRAFVQDTTEKAMEKLKPVASVLVQGAAKRGG